MKANPTQPTSTTKRMCLVEGKVIEGRAKRLSAASPAAGVSRVREYSMGLKRGYT